ncbi:hypothetical protein [Paraburkholderia fungorum]|jgi:hypothetical protein|uniref:Uncharacterized protein n=1 Tax=Paraburkholderia fungorum TaxID=134537 RepID=A0AAW3V7D5_9BURK|nr:hypothetical protein [Paraburkholderia fungorum]AJZ56413.1 hypothetical protein OI25_8098 [Paraburkholderia fungorum]MBB5545341.1 hypothetical protein [Paraburkholderia fungorum]MBB6205126.1 hypothetical protein [Paraburkholderia fungorum]MBU7440729.1 hypothetical protein [Paraburkholderia fungorum]MDE1012520.1 hypothetical protein [Paraburkholderia fungorum]
MKSTQDLPVAQTPSHPANNHTDQFTVAKLPIDRESISSRRLLEMMEQVELLPAPGNRTIWEMLLDAGADAGHLRYRDPKDDCFSVFPAALQFRITTAKLNGFLIIEDDPENRCYRLHLQHEEGIGMHTIPKQFYLKSLASEIYRLVDDGVSRSHGSACELIVDDAGSHIAHIAVM